MSDSVSHDAILQRHRARFEAHRQWLREQQAALNNNGGGDGLGAAPATSERIGLNNTARRQEGGPSATKGTPTGSPRGEVLRMPTAAATVEVTAPAYSEAQRSQRTAVAAAWVEDMAAQLQNHPREREYSPNYAPPPRAAAGPSASYRNAKSARYVSGSSNLTGRAAARGPQHRYDADQEEGDGYDDEQQQQHYDEDDGVYYEEGNAQEGGDAEEEDEEQSYDKAQLMLLEGSPLHVYSRATQWARRREQKLLEMREMMENRELNECTFRPDRIRVVRSLSSRRHQRRGDALLHQDQSSTSPSFPNQGALIPLRSASSSATYPRGRGNPALHYDASAASMSSNVNVSTVAEVSGWEEFMCRRLRAKQLEEEKKSRIRSDGSKWTGAPTVVEEFNLGVPASATTHGRKLQKVLKPPVVAPNAGLRAAVGAQLILPSGSLQHRGAFSNKGIGNQPQQQQQQQQPPSSSSPILTSRNASNTHPVLRVFGKVADLGVDVSLEGDEALQESSAAAATVRALDVPTVPTGQLPPRGLFSIRGSSTFVDTMVSGASAFNNNSTYGEEMT